MIDHGDGKVYQPSLETSRGSLEVEVSRILGIYLQSTLFRPPTYPFAKMEDADTASLLPMDSSIEFRLLFPYP